VIHSNRLFRLMSIMSNLSILSNTSCIGGSHIHVEESVWERQKN
jgi:hypothetical protein